MISAPDGSTLPQTQVLAGATVVSIAINLPGPACLARLAELGAACTKVEPPAAAGGDPLRTYAKAYYDELHAHVAVLVLNLKDDAGRAALDGLLAGADILLTSQRAGALDRLGLDWPSLAGRFPRLCQVAIVGSVVADDAGHDLTYLASAGLADPPHLPATLLADLGGAERAVTATLSALRLREATGRGHRVTVALDAAAAAFAGPRRHGLTAPGGLLAGAHPGYHYYRAEDGWIALAALEPHFAARLAKASGQPLEAGALAAFFAAGNCAGWRRWADQHDIPLAALPHSPTS